MLGSFGILIQVITLKTLGSPDQDFLCPTAMVGFF